MYRVITESHFFETDGGCLPTPAIERAALEAEGIS